MPISSLLIRKEKDDDEVIPTYPGTVVASHAITRSVPCGFVCGTLLGGVAKLVRPQLNYYLWPSCGSMLGLFGGVALLLNMARTKENFDDDGVKDRSYRLYYNVPQRNFEDRAKWMIPLSFFVGALPITNSVPMVHRISIATGVALTINFGLMLQETSKQKEKEGESALRSMD